MFCNQNKKYVISLGVPDFKIDKLPTQFPYTKYYEVLLWKAKNCPLNPYIKKLND